MPTRTRKPTPTRTAARASTRPSRPRATTTATAEALQDDAPDLSVVDQSGAPVKPLRQIPARTATRRPAPAAHEDDVDQEDADLESVDVDVEVRGYDFVFTVPAEVDDWPLDVLVAFEEGKAAVAVRGMLGTEQWRDLQLVNPRVRDLKHLFDAIAKAVGLGNQGE